MRKKFHTRRVYMFLESCIHTVILLVSSMTLVIMSVGKLRRINARCRLIRCLIIIHPRITGAEVTPMICRGSIISISNMVIRRTRIHVINEINVISEINLISVISVISEINVINGVNVMIVISVISVK